MNYEVWVIDDDQLPLEIAWAFVRSGDDEFMFIKRSTAQSIVSRDELVILVESVTGLPCPCKRGVGCPLLDAPPAIAKAV